MVFKMLLMSSLTMLILIGCDRLDGETNADQLVATNPEGTESILQNPTTPEQFVTRARYRYVQKNYGDAIHDMASAMRVDSINEEYHHLLADIYLHSLKSQLALQTLERAVLLFPQSRLSWLKIAELQIILLQFDNAASSISHVLQMNPRDVEGLYLLGILYREQSEIVLAIQSLQTVVEIDADHKEAWNLLGNLLDIKDDPSALQCFENVISIDSTYPQGWHSKAFYLQNHGNVSEALRIYEKIHAIDSSYSDAYLNAGILYLEQSDGALAEENFSNVVRINSGSAIGHYYLGITYESAELLDRAIEHLEQAQSLAPSASRFANAVLRVREKLNN